MQTTLWTSTSETSAVVEAVGESGGGGENKVWEWH